MTKKMPENKGGKNLTKKIVTKLENYVLDVLCRRNILTQLEEHHLNFKKTRKSRFHKCQLQNCVAMIFRIIDFL